MKLRGRMTVLAAIAGMLAACGADDARMAGDDPIQDSREARGMEDPPSPPVTSVPSEPAPEDGAASQGGTLSNGRGGAPTPDPERPPG